MLDTVNLWLPQSHTSTAILNNLERVSEVYSLTTAKVSCFGYLGNYKVSIYNYGISLKGSLAKYYLGDNFQTLTRKGTEEAIESLSDKLGINVNKAGVKRVDIAENLIMKHKHQAYYDLLGDCPRLERQEKPKSIYYSNSKKQLVFYNKVAEGKHRGLKLPEAWNNKQVLRYEFRYMKKPHELLDMPMFTAQNLYDEGVYMKMVDGWFNHYQQVNKIRLHSFTKETMNNAKLLGRQLMLKGLEAYGGEQEFLRIIDRSRAEGKLNNRGQAKRLKDKILDLSNDKILTEESELITELDMKVKQAREFYR